MITGLQVLHKKILKTVLYLKHSLGHSRYLWTRDLKRTQKRKHQKAKGQLGIGSGMLRSSQILLRERKVMNRKPCYYMPRN